MSQDGDGLALPPSPTSVACFLVSTAALVAPVLAGAKPPLI